MSRLAKDLAELSARPAAQLAEAWTAVSKAPMPCVPEPLLRRLIAQHLQEKRLGSVSTWVQRGFNRIASTPGGAKPAPRPVHALTPGPRLIREWNSRTIAVEVQEDGFLWGGQRYRSLSDSARSVTGAHWSGPHFFGVRSHG